MKSTAPDNERPWLAKYDPEVPWELPYEYIPLFEYLDRAAEKWPKRKALIFQNFRLTYAKLKKMTETVAANLRAQGVRPGDRVAVMLPNTPQAIITYWGILRAGAVVVMTNPLYMETEILHQFNDSGARALVILDLLWPKVEKLRDQIPIEKFFVTSIADCLAFPLNLLYKVKARRDGHRPVVPFDGTSVLPWATLTKGSDSFTFQGVNPRKDMAVLQYTGGTTGVSKGCMLSHANLGANVQQCRALLHTLGDQQETFIGILPYFHIYGLTVCMNLATMLGATQVPFPRYSPKDVLKAIHKIRPTIFPGAPALYISLLQQKDVAKYDLKSIKFCVSGSAPMPVEYIDQFKKMTGAEILEGFGLTEASPVTHLNPLSGKRKPGSIGMPFPDTDAWIVDMEVGSVTLPPGKMGELVIRGPQVMMGYFNRPDATADVLRNGRLYTGDIATMDEDGYFYIVDRKKDLIISAGYNIYPREIDEVLHSHPKIKEAVAVGIPHGTRGEVVKVFVVLEDGEKMTKSEVIAFCRGKLANYKVPRLVEFRTSLPKTMVGKVLRRALRSEEDQRRKSGGAEEQLED
ncbi:AMP-binding protein [Desulfovibrio aminophilus]|uniref:long-chain-fatty-acid--CoA ligase n=1 Tax=Desulfovibrio aminophilus TaxID=81425 RepID=UPI0033982BD9